MTTHQPWHTPHLIKLADGTDTALNPNLGAEIDATGDGGPEGFTS